jgi:hypothetical protein
MLHNDFDYPELFASYDSDITGLSDKHNIPWLILCDE